jgi:hypothetical protein
VAHRKLYQILIAAIVAVVGTFLTIKPGLAEYWWVILLTALVLLVLRVVVNRNARRTVVTSITLLYRLVSNYERYVDRAKLALSSEWENVTTRVVEERDELERRNRRLRRAIRTLALEHKRASRLREEIETRIDADGSSTRVRRTEVIATVESISWIDVGYGTTVAAPAERGVILDDPEVLSGDGRELDFEIYDDKGSERRMLVFLHQPTRVGGQPAVVRIVQRRRRTWVDLIEHLEDFGRYVAENAVERLSFTIWVPTALHIQSFMVEPPAGEWKIGADGLSATWRVADLPAGAYKFSIRCLRRATDAGGP